ncbi:MAG: prepilin-type N-terminal cleavage/methylation domain-containing protein [Planctomycetes bacterium]|nr:prepilin-type N-terminal cleavage/methylation domain-containing protein [Planctomycetota bacterium]
MNTLELSRRARRGFTLIEMIVAIAIMAVLVGAAVPVTSKILAYKAKKATREELQVLADACAELFRDSGVLPDSVADLLADSGVSGWSGPYLPGVVTDAVSGLSGYEVDAWSRPYQLDATADVLSITSSGGNATFGDTDDLEIALDVTWIRRQQTLDELKLINQAVQLYNGLYLTTDPLDSDWSSALDQLVLRGMLPTKAEYLNDAWGVPYVSDPQGLTPVVRIQSTSVNDGL